MSFFCRGVVKRGGACLEGRIFSYTLGMKTAISVPDELFAQAEVEAEKQGVSRSELYRVALREYLKRRLGEDIKEKVNRYFEAHPEDRGLEPDLRRASQQTLRRNEW